MNDISINVNKYNDKIITSTNPVTALPLEELIEKMYNKEESTIVKTLGDFNYEDFVFVGQHGATKIFANTIALKKCPTIINNMFTGSAVVTFVTCETETYVVLVQRVIGNQLLTNPCGLRGNADESFEKCAIREMFEETGIVGSLENIIYQGEFEFGYFCYDETWPNTTKVFSTNLLASNDALNDILTHKDLNGKINKTFTINVKELDSPNCPKISEHHLCAIKHILENRVDSKYNFPYLKSFAMERNTE